MKEKQGENAVILGKVAAKIKYLRIAKGYSSYEKFAIEHDFSLSQYWRIEKGSNLTLSTLDRVLEIHQISWTDFFSDIDNYI